MTFSEKRTTLFRIMIQWRHLIAVNLYGG